MRVISGTAKAKKLISKPGDSTRPTIDRVKEAIFNILQNDIYSSSILDLFAGSGALGIEALSRGAKKAVFVEKDHEASLFINDNLKNTGLADKATLLLCDALDYLKSTDTQFDIIFIDPPYASGLYRNVFRLILGNRILADNGKIICERKTGTPPPLYEGFTLLSDRKYGNVSVSVIKQNLQK